MFIAMSNIGRGLKRLNKEPSASVLAQEKMEDAQRKLIEAENAQLYHAKMAEYYRTSIAMFKSHVKAAE